MSCTYSAGAYLGELDGGILGRYLGLLDSVKEISNKRYFADSEEFLRINISDEVIEQGIIQTRYGEIIDEYHNFCDLYGCYEEDSTFGRLMSGFEDDNFLDGYKNNLMLTAIDVYNEWYNIGLSIADEAYEYIVLQIES